MLFFELAGGLDLIILLISPLFSPLSVVTVNIAVLTHTVGVELIMWTVPGLLIPTVLVVAVTAHALGVVLLLRVAAVIGLLSSLIKYITFSSWRTSPRHDSLASRLWAVSRSARGFKVSWRGVGC